MLLNLLTLYKADDTIFDGLELPNAPTNLYPDQYTDPVAMDKDTMIQWLLFKTAELEIYPSSPDAIKGAVTLWSSIHQQSWQKLYDTYFYKYNPIWNKDGQATKGHTGTVTDAGTNSYTDTHSVVGFNTLTEPAVNDVLEHEGSDGNTRTYGDTETTSESGNIGVTMTQRMIQAERELWLASMYDYICDQFISEFCLNIY